MVYITWFGPLHRILALIALSSNEDLNQPAQLRILTRAFAARMYTQMKIRAKTFTLSPAVYVNMAV